MKPKSKKMANGNKPPKPPKPPHGKPEEPTWVPAPTGLTVNVTGTSAALSWNAVAPIYPPYYMVSYWIYRTNDGLEYVPAIIQVTNYTDASLKPGGTYTYEIAAVLHDANGVSTLGPKSDPVTITL